MLLHRCAPVRVLRLCNKVVVQENVCHRVNTLGNQIDLLAPRVGVSLLAKQRLCTGWMCLLIRGSRGPELSTA